MPSEEIRDAQTAMMGRWALGLEDSFRRASGSPSGPARSLPAGYWLGRQSDKAGAVDAGTALRDAHTRTVIRGWVAAALDRPDLAESAAARWTERVLSREGDRTHGDAHYDMLQKPSGRSSQPSRKSDLESSTSCCNGSG